MTYLDLAFFLRPENRRSVAQDATELFGGPGLSGYAELATWDSNGDGIVSADDLAFTDLQIWRDANENGITDAGELHALAAFGITAFSLNAQATNITTANGTIIRAESFYAREDGTTGALGELIFETERGNTRYLGDDRVAANDDFEQELTAMCRVGEFDGLVCNDRIA